MIHATEQSYLMRALRLAFPSDIPFGKRYLFVFDLTAYYDESGTHDDSDRVVLAGFIAESERWLAFEPQWKQALVDFELPLDKEGLRHFHMVDFANRAPPYHKWTEPVRRERLNRLLDLIKDHAEASVAVVVPRLSYEAATTPTERKLTQGPYGFAALTAFAVMQNVMVDDAYVTCYFEDGVKNAGDMISIYQDAKKLDAPEIRHILSISLQDKRRFVPLQAADILAYEIYKFFPKNDLVDPDMRYPYQELTKIPHEWVYADDELLKLSAAVWAEEMGNL